MLSWGSVIGELALMLAMGTWCLCTMGDAARLVRRWGLGLGLIK